MDNIYKNKILIFFDKNTKKILTTFEPHDTIIEINDFIMGRLKYDDNFKNLIFSDIGYSILQLDFYNRYVNTPSAVNKEFFINENNEAELRVIKNNSNDNSQMCYSSQLFKRYYSEDTVKKIYNEDYINFNLKNILKSGFLKAEFIPIKDLKIRSHLLYRPWGHFFSDPYLFDYDDDKLKLGRSILEMGTYYPFQIGPKDENIDDNMYVLEGNHRIISLKLLAAAGEIDDDFKVLCIRMPFMKGIYYNDLIKPLPENVPLRYIVETVYGSEILNDELLLNSVKQDVSCNNEKFINDYTVEGSAKTMQDIVSGLHIYPLFIRDLIYMYDNTIKPNKVINDEQAFKEWLNE